MSDLSEFTKPDCVYELNIGKSFTNGSKVSYHQFKYDFTPAAIDKNQEAKVNIGIKNDVSIEVPHVEGASEKYTQFTGNKQPCSNKECVLIFDTKTGQFTLERLESNFFLKKDRLNGSSKAQQLSQRSITPTNENKNAKKMKSETTIETTTPNTSKKDDNSVTTSAKSKVNKDSSLKTESIVKTIKKEEIAAIENTKSSINDLNLSSDSDDAEL